MISPVIESHSFSMHSHHPLLLPSGTDDFDRFLWFGYALSLPCLRFSINFPFVCIFLVRCDARTVIIIGNSKWATVLSMWAWYFLVGYFIIFRIFGANWKSIANTRAAQSTQRIAIWPLKIQSLSVQLLRCTLCIWLKWLVCVCFCPRAPHTPNSRSLFQLCAPHSLSLPILSHIFQCNAMQWNTSTATIKPIPSCVKYCGHLKWILMRTPANALLVVFHFNTC